MKCSKEYPTNHYKTTPHMKAQLAADLGSPPISIFSYLPSRWLGCRSDKTHSFGESQYSNHMTSNTIDNSIQLPCYWLLGWDHDSKLSIALDIASCCRPCCVTILVSYQLSWVEAFYCFDFQWSSLYSEKINK